VGNARSVDDEPTATPRSGLVPSRAIEPLSDRTIMTKFLLSFCVAVAALVSTPIAHANDYADLRVKATAARESLVTMLTNKDKRGPDQQKIVKDTADVVSAQLTKLKAPAGKDAQLKELVEVWGAFKKTREADLVPAILAGRDDEARKLAGGVQKERYTRVQELIGELGG
jgi:hypothetical protein